MTVTTRGTGPATAQVSVGARLEQLAWAVAGIVFALPAPEPITSRWGLVLGILTILLGARVFWFHGGPRITAPGLWALSTSIFGGFAGVYWHLSSSRYDDLLYVPLLACYLVLVALWGLFWSDPSISAPGPEVADWSVPHTAAIAGAVAAAAAAGFWVSGTRVGLTLIQEVAFAGLSLVSTALVLSNARARTHWVRLVLGLLVVAVFAQTVFTGYGRLILVSLGLAPVIIVSWRAHNRQLKAALLVGVAPALLVFVRMRESFGQQTYGSSLSGIGSVITPLRDFGRLLELSANGGFEPAQGRTFVAAIVVWIPRQWWPGKPVGFGAELTQLLEPALVSVNQSMAALALGEWLYDFGWLGIVLLVPVIGLTLRMLDTLCRRATNRPVNVHSRHLIVVVSALLVCDIPNLFWVGTFGYFSRTLLRVGVVVVIFALLQLVPRVPGAETTVIRASATRRSGSRRTARSRARP